MTQIHAELLTAIADKLKKSERTARRRIQDKATELLVEDHLAAIALAQELGMRVNKYASTEQLEALRKATNSPAIVRVPVQQEQPSVETTPQIASNLGFISDTELKKILKRDLAELNVHISSGIENTQKSCMVLSGSIAEALLLDALKQNETEAVIVGSKVIPQGVPTDLDDWGLFVMVEVATSLSSPLLTVDTKSGAHQLRKWRNLIHPGRELKDSKSKGIRPTPGRANSAVSFLRMVIEGLEKTK